MKKIFGDKLEQDRIQLEHNLQHTNLSLHLSYDPSDCSSVEYPRRNPGPSQFPDFNSFDAHHIRDDFDQDSHDHLHSFSYHAAHGEEGINPFSGETMSTAAHHASALTISAGLAARTPRNVSMSGAEYDPDRPLQDLMAGAKHILSFVDGDPSQMNYFVCLILLHPLRELTMREGISM
jgi:hypothetical protein